MPDERLPGQALATRRAVADIVRRVTLGSYGVVDLGETTLSRATARLAGRSSGLRVSLGGGRIDVALRLRVAHGVPIAEVARQVESAIRFAIREALHRDVDRLSIRIAGLEVRPASSPPVPRDPHARDPGAPRPGELADSGTDVA